VGEAADGVEAVLRTRSLVPDVIVLDLAMPRQDGLQAISTLRAENPQTRILVLTSFGEDDMVFPAIKRGAMGYLLKDSSPEDLLHAIRDVYAGDSSLHPAIAHKLIRQFSEPPPETTPVEPLTEREIEVLRWVAQGMCNEEIADRLDISERTVRSHMTNILGKLQLTNRTQAALYALREGLASLDEF
jgi:NarL family two-component system response regulator LiaR